MYNLQHENNSISIYCLDFVAAVYFAWYVGQLEFLYAKMAIGLV